MTAPAASKAAISQMVRGSGMQGARQLLEA